MIENQTYSAVGSNFAMRYKLGWLSRQSLVILLHHEGPGIVSPCIQLSKQSSRPLINLLEFDNITETVDVHS